MRSQHLRRSHASIAGFSRRAGSSRSTSPSSGATASCCIGSSGATSRSGTSRPTSAHSGPIFRPLVSIVLFSIIFGKLAGISTGSSIPYPLFALGLLPWTYFSSAFTGAAGSILNNTGLLQKVYFPRIYAPLTAAVTPLIDLRADDGDSDPALHLLPVRSPAGTSSSRPSSSCWRSSSGSGSGSGSTGSWSGTGTRATRCPSRSRSACTSRLSSIRRRSSPSASAGCSRSTR